MGSHGGARPQTAYASRRDKWERTFRSLAHVSLLDLGVWESGMLRCYAAPGRYHHESANPVRRDAQSGLISFFSFWKHGMSASSAYPLSALQCRDVHRSLCAMIVRPPQANTPNAWLESSNLFPNFLAIRINSRSRHHGDRRAYLILPSRMKKASAGHDSSVSRMG